MKTKHCFFAVVFLLTASLLFSTAGFAQPGRYRHGHSRYYSPRYYPQRNYYYNRPYVSVAFGNSHYRYQGGYFYRPYGSSFQFVIPPFGIRIQTLPPGYRRMNVGPDPYYYYQGTYYRPYGSDQYEVVAPPLGAVVNELPPGAKVTVIDGQKYYELKGTYYQEEITANNELQYTVVGTDGVLDTGNTENTGREPGVGDRTDALPADSKAVVINGEKLYAAPSGLYYKEVIEGNKVYYEVVGK
jgi:Family of unknown function (DUF6515)